MVGKCDASVGGQHRPRDASVWQSLGERTSLVQCRHCGQSLPFEDAVRWVRRVRASVFLFSTCMFPFAIYLAIGPLGDSRLPTDVPGVAVPWGSIVLAGAVMGAIWTGYYSWRVRQVEHLYAELERGSKPRADEGHVAEGR